MIKKLHRLWVVLMALLAFNANAQIIDRAPNPCRAEDHVHEQRSSSRQMADEAPWYPQEGKFIIPVVFHVFGNDFDGLTLSVDKVEDALVATNEDFQGLRADFQTVAAAFQNIKEGMNVEFRLAKLDPEGNPTTGVTYHPEMSGFGNGSGYDAEIQKVAWDNAKYMNVYIMHDLYNDGDTYNSGVAWLPDMGMTEANIARVVHNGKYVGSNTNENFRSVLTHEFGHFLGLRHTFNGGCSEFNNDDGVEDTPKQDDTSKNMYRNTGSYINCNGKEVNRHNFMDYSDNYAMFTRGQVGRMTGSSFGLRHPARITLWQQQNLEDTGVADDFNLGPHVTYETSLFEEKFINNGEIESSIAISAQENAQFAITGDLQEGVHYSITNVPAGLTANINVISSTQASISLQGIATSHTVADNVSDMTLTFLDAAFVGGVAGLYNPSNSSLSVSFNDPYTSYCIPSTQYGAFYSHIVSVQMNNITSTSGNTEYSDYTDTYATSARPGETVPVTIITNKGSSGDNDQNYIRVWADWNGNFVYESDELITTHNYVIGNVVDADGNFTYQLNLNVPDDAVEGKIGVRVMVHYFENGSTDGQEPCANYETGEVEDYGLNIIPKDAPFEANFTFGPKEVIFADPVSFSDLSTTPEGVTITKWEWSFPGGEPANFEGQVPPPVYYSEVGTYDATLKVTNSNGEVKEITKEDEIIVKFEYCEPYVRYGGYTGITNVSIGEINNETDRYAGSNNYFDAQETVVNTGESYPLTITLNKGASGDVDSNRIQIWIDWNYNSAYDDDELIDSHVYKVGDSDAEGNYTFSTNIAVPFDARIEKVGMRILVHYVQNSEGDTACGTIDSGESEDYGLVIQKGDKQALVDFKADDIAPVINTPIYFTDLTSVSNANLSITNWSWTFDGGQPASASGQTPPAVRYAEPGEYNVSLEVTLSDGTIEKVEKSAYVNAQYKLCDIEGEIWDFLHVTKVEFGSVSNTSESTNINKNYMDTHNMNIRTGETIDMTVVTNTGKSWDNEAYLLRVWADWNYNASLDQGELVATKNITAAGKGIEATHNFSFTVPDNAATGKTIALRVMTSGTRNAPVGGECGQFHSGEAEDYGLNILDQSASIIPDFTVDYANPVVDTEVTFQNLTAFYNGVTGAEFEWTFEGGEPASYIGETPPDVKYNATGLYDVTLKVTGSNGEVQTISKSNMIQVKNYELCTPTSAYWGYGHIGNVKVGDIDFSNGNTNVHNDLMTSQNTDINPGETLKLTITANTGDSGDGDNIRIIAWADWNYNGEFEANEIVAQQDFASQAKNADEVVEVDITAPEDAAAGRTVALRVVVHYLESATIDACQDLDSGEVEDYGLNIIDEDAILSIDSLNSTISVYPNPTNGLLNISQQVEKAVVYSTLGQKMLEVENTGNLDLNGMESGVYLLQLSTESSTSTLRVVLK
ncbi:M43 family zinc metalloprotease [Aureibacter tunicatorum]|uniref:PKD domain-containing protein n=1 Tax=Aureibacter tunicatorum TaxID=866807 RepID=A0AAE3XJW4_9BACT|nr:M43 family zinc metalloprotease [Aureibacter tunicatorum]MDR6237757.1 hypothetical protein [Aureibacter tunicatorum]BDD02792.1 hypothetical protein AUTU_02750 [Aureibacter tunicatorum]